MEYSCVQCGRKFIRERYLKNHQKFSKYSAVDNLSDNESDSNVSRSDSNNSYGSSASISNCLSSLASLHYIYPTFKFPAANKVVAAFFREMKSETPPFDNDSANGPEVDLKEESRLRP
eukprot:3316287-Ditylum_brightwellii.AAC.1